jgi:hypothetical protein
MSWKRCGRKRLWPNNLRYFSSICKDGLRKAIKLVSITGHRVEIWTGKSRSEELNIQLLLSVVFRGVNYVYTYMPLQCQSKSHRHYFTEIFYNITGYCSFWNYWRLVHSILLWIKMAALRHKQNRWSYSTVKGLSIKRWLYSVILLSLD